MIQANLQTVYQTCSKCNAPRVHTYSHPLELTCIKCRKTHHISASRGKIERDPELLQQVTTDINPITIPQPKGLTAFLKGVMQ